MVQEYNTTNPSKLQVENAEIENFFRDWEKFNYRAIPIQEGQFCLCFLQRTYEKLLKA